MSNNKMTRKQAEAYAAELQGQADAIQEAVRLKSSDEGKNQLLSAAARFRRMAARALEDQKFTPVRALDDDASEEELFQARKYQAVKHGDATYLPSWAQSSDVAFPNLLIRSALFSTDSDHAVLINESVATVGDSRIVFTGEKLDRYDQRVYAACIRAYRQRPLATTFDSTDYQTTFYKFIEELMGVSYSVETHLAVRNSFEHLVKARLGMSHRGYKLEASQLLYATFQDGLLDEEHNHKSIPDIPAAGSVSKEEYKAARSARKKRLGELFHGRDELGFSLTWQLAELFGPQDWTLLPRNDPTKIKGLTSWIADFYASHSKPFPARMNWLYKLSGSDSRMKLFKFRDAFQQALKILESAPDNIRVANFRYDKDTDEITVTLDRWHKKLAKRSPGQSSVFSQRRKNKE